MGSTGCVSQCGRNLYPTISMPLANHTPTITPTRDFVSGRTPSVWRYVDVRPPCRDRRSRRGKAWRAEALRPLLAHTSFRSERLPPRLCRPRHAVWPCVVGPVSPSVPTRDKVSGRSVVSLAARPAARYLTPTVAAPARLIASAGELEILVGEVRAAGRLALDTEFVWERTYRPQLGVVQVATDGAEVAVVDAR